MPYRLSRAPLRSLAPGCVSGSAFPSCTSVTLAHQLGSLTPLSSGPLRSPHLPLPWAPLPDVLAPWESFHCSRVHCLLPMQWCQPGCFRLYVPISHSPAHSVPHPGPVCSFWIFRALSRRGVPLPCSPDSLTSLLGVVCRVPGRCPSGTPGWEFAACLSPRMVSHLLSYPDSDLLLFPWGTPTLTDHLGALCPI